MKFKIKGWKPKGYEINFFSLGFIFWILYFFLGIIFAQDANQDANIENKIKFKLSFTNITNKADAMKDTFAGYYSAKNQEIYVLDKGNNRVVIIGESGEIKYQFDIAPAEAISLTVDEDDNSYVLENLNDNKQKIYSYNFRGDLIEEYGIPKKLYESTRETLIGKIKILKDYMFLSDVVNNKIIIMLWNTKEVVKVFGGEGETPGLFKHLTDFDVDKNGKTYVIDMYISKVSVFSDKGEFLTQFGEPGGTEHTLSLPVGIAVNEELVTFVVDSTRHTILVYNNKGEFLFEFGGYGKSEGWFYYPQKIFVSGNKVFIIEPFLGRVQMYELQKDYFKLPS